MRTILMLLFLMISQVSLAQNPPVYKQMTDSVFEVGDRIIVPNSWPMLTWKIPQEALPALLQIDTFLKQNPELVIEIGSHLDTRSSDAYNLRLSQHRAESYWELLVLEWNHDSARINHVGYGETQPIFSDSQIYSITDEIKRDKLHQINRRIELRVIGKNGVIAETLDTIPQLNYRYKFLIDTSFEVGDRIAILPLNTQASKHTHCDVHPDSKHLADSILRWLLDHRNLQVEIVSSNFFYRDGVKCTSASALVTYLFRKRKQLRKRILPGSPCDELMERWQFDILYPRARTSPHPWRLDGNGYTTPRTEIRITSIN